MIEEYIQHWGLSQHPFLLAPDSRMMHMAGQYYECLERLKYAVNTNKGGALVVSEDAGLGKTTILLKLINEMKEQYGSTFKYAFIDHPTLTSNQLIAYIAGCFTNSTPNEDNRPRNLTIDFIHNRMQVVSDLSHHEDKLKNLMILKEALINIKQQGGKSIIIVDEGQMLCGARDILQELRALINLTFNNEYLHTFILSGQRPLWNEVKSMPEFWQRLPVRYYFVPLRLDETRELIKYRLIKAGLNDEREIFTNDALEIMQRYSMGSPRTIIALADLALLIGFTDRSSKIGFKELSKAINAMSGKGESLPYIAEGKKKTSELTLDSFTEFDRGNGVIERQMRSPSSGSKKDLEYRVTTSQIRPFFAVLAIVFSIIAGTVLGYYYTFSERKVDNAVLVKKEIAIKEDDKQTQADKEDKTEPAKPEGTERIDSNSPGKTEKEALVIKTVANIRNGPDIHAPRIGMLLNGEKIKVIDEKMDTDGKKWYKFYLYGDREGWISEQVVVVK